MSLQPCPSCARHVRVSESACPFCGGELVLVEPPPMPVARAGRAAVFLLGVAAAASSASGCVAAYGGPSAYDANTVNDAATVNDAGTDAGFLAMYGGPPNDASTHEG